MSTTAATMPGTLTGFPGWIPPGLYRMTVEQYEAMAASGAIPESHRVHLIHGLLVQKMTQNPPHMVADDLCGQELARVLPGWYIRAAKPVRLPVQASEPEPDRSVVRGTTRDYEGRTPGPADIVMVVEVADSSLAKDRTLADAVYGPAAIPVYWIVNLVHRQVEVYTGPGPGGYALTEVYSEGQSVPVVIDGREVGRIAVVDILPRARPAAGSESGQSGRG